MRSKHPHLIFFLVNVLELVRLLSLYAMPAVLVLWQFNAFLSGDGITTFHYVIDVIMLVVWSFVYMAAKPLQKLTRHYRNEIEFDKNGMSYEFDELQSLNKKERQEIVEENS